MEEISKNPAHVPMEEQGILDVMPLRTLAPMFLSPVHGFITPLMSEGPAPVSTVDVAKKPGEDGSPTTSNGGVKLREDFNPNISPVIANEGSKVGQDTNAKASPLHTKEAPQLTAVTGTDDKLVNTPKSPWPKRKQSDLTSSEGSKLRRKRNKHKRSVMSHENQSVLAPQHTVESVLMTYDALRRKLAQMKEQKPKMKEQKHKGSTQTSELPKAGTLMMLNDHRVNTEKKIGSVPGIEVGDFFYSRIEMCLVGLHSPNIAGVDFMKVKSDKKEDLVAICIVSADGYENVEEGVDVLIYTGPGGGVHKSDKKQVGDQKLEGGNLALKGSWQQGNEIRVIRTVKDPAFKPSSGKKIFIYDGVYKIQAMWIQKGTLGFERFKFKLPKEPGQPERFKFKLLKEPEQPYGFAVWKMTEKWKKKPSTRGKFISLDMTSGLESPDVCLVNDVDEEKLPSFFTYNTKVNYPNHILSKTILPACLCNSGCSLPDANCSCVQRNGGVPPFNSNGVLVSCKPLIYECNDSCHCSKNCKNQVTQKGVKLHFEVFRTDDRGWGLRSWDAIRTGTFVCEYIGEVMETTKVEEDDEYLFRALRPGDKTCKWNIGPELVGKWNIGPELVGEPSIDIAESLKPLPIILSAKRRGNIARFINHSCSPNIFWQPILHDHGDEGYPHIMFFAIKNIPPMTELTFDYRSSGDRIAAVETDSGAGSRGLKKCLCGSSNCQGFFG